MAQAKQDIGGPPGRTRILFVTGSFGTGGKERQLAELIRSLPSDRFECHLLVKNNPGHFHSLIKDRLASFHDLNSPSFKISHIVRIAALIREVRPEIVHSWATITSHLAALSRFMSRTEFMLLNGSIRSAPARMSFSERVEAVLYGFYDNVVANSVSGLKAFRQHGRNGRHVIRNGFDFSRISGSDAGNVRTSLGIPHSAFVLSMVASMTRTKDYDTVLRAVRELVGRLGCEGVVLVCAGAGPERGRLELLASSLGLSCCVKFLGDISDAEALISSSDVSVLSSKNGEGMSNTLVESMACGIPVLSSDFPGNRELTEDGRFGLLFKPGDPLDMAEKIAYLKDNPAKASEMAGQARAYVQENYSSKKMADEYVGLYEYLLSRKAQAG